MRVMRMVPLDLGHAVCDQGTTTADTAPGQASEPSELRQRDLPAIWQRPDGCACQGMRRPSLSYEDFREAWLPGQGFGFPTRVVSAQRVDDEREVITIGFSELSEAEAESQFQRIAPQEQVRHDRIDAVVEPDMTRHF